MTETRIIQTPARYIQGPNLVKELGKLVSPYGKHFLFLAEEFVFNLKHTEIEESFKACDMTYELVPFQGECCRKEIDRASAICKEKNVDAVIGFGGGKTLDTGKYVAFTCGLPFISCPTIASTDAPCSSVVVIYTDHGEVEISTNVPENPKLVVVDSQMVADAPLRLFVAGMGDALSTYFEARVTYDLGRKNILGGCITDSALMLARASYDILMEDGVQAKKDLEAKQLTMAVERVIEADTYLSGVGFESGGLSAAHGIHNALKNLEGTHTIDHGALVAFGTLCLVEMEKRGGGEFERILQFCEDVGLPTTLEQVGIHDNIEAQVRQVSVDATKQAPKYNMPLIATPEVIYQAIMAVDAAGRALKNK